MNKKIFITSFVCAHLLVTPHLHAWQMPKVDGKQVGIVAAVSAVLLVLMGCAWYKHAKKVSVDQPAAQPAGDEQVTIQQFTRKQLEEGARFVNELSAKVEAQAASEAQAKLVLEALTKQIAELQGAQEQQKQAVVNGFEALPSRQEFASRDETIGLMLRNYLHIK